MKRYRAIAAAENTAMEDQFEDAIDAVEADFEYVIDGLRTIAREGTDAQRQAMQMVLQLNDSVSDMIQRVADVLAE